MGPSTPGSHRCTILIPAHNEEATIRSVTLGALEHGCKVLIINDGSTDGTIEALAGLPVEILDHRTNRGKGWRIAEGLEHAVARGADSVLTLDSDGQHDPADIAPFLAAARENPDCLVFGDRSADRGAMPFGRAASIGFGDFFIGWACGRQVHDAQCGMRLYPAKLWREVRVPADEQAHFVFETAILMRAAEFGYDFVRVPIRARYAGFVQRPSHYRPAIDTMRIVWTVTKFLLRRGLKPNGLLRALGWLK